MKVIISGGTGLIGRGLTKSLAADGHEVVVLTRGDSRAAENVRYVHWDGVNQGEWAGEIDGAQAVVNLAGFSMAGTNLLNMRWTKARKEKILNSRLDAGRAMTEAVRAAKEKPGVFVQASAIGYYGPRGNEPIDEQASGADDFLAGVTREWEMSTAEIESMGVRRVVVRTGIVLIKGNLAFDMLNLPVKLFVGTPIGSGKQYLAWIHYDDYIRALRFLIENGESRGAYNLTAPSPVRNSDYMRTAAKVLRRPFYPLPLPGFLLEVALGKVAMVVLEGQRVIPARLQAEGFEFQYPELKPALENLLKK